jgi:hypothetical protein
MVEMANFLGHRKQTENFFKKLNTLTNLEENRDGTKKLAHRKG